MSPSPEEERSPDETLQVEVPIAPHALRDAKAPAPGASPARPSLATTAARPDAAVDRELRHKARSWLSNPEATRESALQAGARAAGAKVRTGVAAAIDHAWVWTRRTLADLREDLRHRDRWFAWKAGIVASWIVLSLVCLGVAGSGGADRPARNGLDAYVVVRSSSLSWALLVENRSGKPWTSIALEVDGHTFRQERLGPDERLVLGPTQFVADGEPLPADRPPRSARLSTAEGTAEIPLGP